MGGLAFAATLHTPRMQAVVYRAVRDRCIEKLRGLYVIVACPIEAPAKTSFGDIDIFVAWERAEILPSSSKTKIHSHINRRATRLSRPLQDIYHILGGVQFKVENTNGFAASMAIPWPSDFPYEEDIEAKVEAHAEMRDVKDIKPLCIQVDVHICPTLPKLQWALFKHAHGDIWNILGSVVRPFGLTIDEVGLYLRIPEIEYFHKNVSKVLLTSEPCDILSFIGLRSDGREWEEPFTSDEDLYEYATTCRLFFARPKEPEPTEVQTDAGANDEAQKQEGVEEEKRKLRANDRRRMAYRPLFRKWIEEYVPSRLALGHLPNSTTTTQPLTRDMVRQQAFDTFPGVEIIYNTRLREWLLQRQRETLWKNIIKPAVPVDMEMNQRSCCASALKKIILDGNDTYDGIMAPSTLKDESGLFIEDNVRAWVEGNWQHVADVAWALYKKRSVEATESKKAKLMQIFGDEQDT